MATSVPNFLVPCQEPCIPHLPFPNPEVLITDVACCATVLSKCASCTPHETAELSGNSFCNISH